MDGAASKECPLCRLINPASAQVCDCGYEFKGNIVFPHEVEEGRRKRKKLGISLIIAGFNSICLGIILTLTISLGTSKAGISVVFYGLIVAGLVMIYKGIMLILGQRI